MYTFTFLPKKSKDPGYFGDKGILSYSFIVENSFFDLLLLFQWIYYHDTFYALLKKSVVFESVLVFLPYVIRTFWPKTRLRDALENPKNKTERNKNFYVVVTWITKIFYVWAKHYIGYFLNYVRFLDRIDEDEKKAVYFVLIFGAFATTIALFLHTLRFKHYIGPRTSYITYMASYLGTFYGFYLVAHIFLKNIDLTLIVLVGVMVNFTNWRVQWAYQFVLLVLFYMERFNLFPVVMKMFEMGSQTSLSGRAIVETLWL